MRHIREAGIRTLYLSFVGGLYLLCSKGDIGLKEVVALGVMVMMYYLTDTLNFRIRRYRLRDILCPLTINLTVIGISGDRIGEGVVAGLVFSMLQGVVRMSLIKMSSEVKNVIIVGEGPRRRATEERLREEIYNYIGYVGRDEGALGREEDLKRIVDEMKVNKVIITRERYSKEESEGILDLRVKGIKVVEYLTFMEDIAGKVDHKNIDHEWLLRSRGFEIFYSRLQKRMKRIFDVSLSSILGMICLPVIVLAALVVRIESPGPIFFRQKRIGEGNREFEIIKFRSMRLHNPEEHSKYAGERDNRITRFGEFMRKTRIDELPQLWLILKGEMSFVGPRPEWNILGSEYEEKIGEVYKLRHTIKPGVTGWAQVMYPYGASLEDAREKLDYDLYYIKNQDLILDMFIFFKTVKTVLFGRGR